MEGADADAEAFHAAVANLARAEKDLEDLGRVHDALRQASNVFTPAELKSFDVAIDRRRRELEASARDLEQRQAVYETRVVRLRELLELRDEVIGRLDGEYDVMTRFPDEMDVVVETHSEFVRNLQQAQAELHH